MNKLDTRDIQVIEEIADGALHFARHGHHRIACGYASTVFSLGFDAILVMLIRWSRHASQAMDTLALTDDGPLWPTRCGRLITDAEQVPPPARWAGRYLAALRVEDWDLADALFESVSARQLAAGAECALLLTAYWVNRSQRKTSDSHR